MTRRTRHTLDATAAGALSTADILARGSQAEIREAIAMIGAVIRAGAPIGAAEREWLGAALEAIGRGEKPHVAFGLNTKRRSLREVVARAAAVDDLAAQGATRTDARRLVGRFDYATRQLADDPEDTADDVLRKHINRRTK